MRCRGQGGEEALQRTPTAREFLPKEVCSRNPVINSKDLGIDLTSSPSSFSKSSGNSSENKLCLGEERSFKETW